MATFKGVVLQCVQCGSDFKVPQCRAKTASTCSHACAVVQRGKSIERKVELICKGCGETFSVPRCHGDRRAYCTYECREAHSVTKERKASKVGEANGSWKGGRVDHSDGYKQVASPGHPYLVNGYLLEHRKVMEDWLLANDPTSEFLTEVDGRLVLSRDYHVHHKDFIKSNNAIENLRCMTPAAHRALHAKVRSEALQFYLHHFPQGDS